MAFALSAAILILTLHPSVAAQDVEVPPPEEDEGQGSRFWVGVRGDYFSGSSDLFEEFDNDLGFGVDVGFGFGHFTMAGEALLMGQGQYLFDANLGAEWLFPKTVRFGVGLFTGPMVFLFSEQQTDGADFSVLSGNQQTQLLDATGLSSIEDAEAQFDAAIEQNEGELGRMAFGWNLARLRLSMDLPVGPLAFGLAGQLGYHMLISGEDVAAGLRNRAIDEYAQRYGLPSDVVGSVREAVGAKAIDTGNLNGINWDFHLYVRIEL